MMKILLVIMLYLSLCSLIYEILILNKFSYVTVSIAVILSTLNFREIYLAYKHNNLPKNELVI